jgi:hypothetical protein
MTLGAVVVEQRIICERVVDLYGWRLEECPFALWVLARSHSNASRFPANSRYACADRDRLAC